VGCQMKVTLNNPNHVPYHRPSMEDNYPGIKKYVTDYMADKKEIVYLGDIMTHLSQFYSFRFRNAHSIRFDGDLSVRYCIYNILRGIGWHRVGTKKQVDSPGFRKV